MISGVIVLFCSDGILTVPFTFATILCLASFCIIRSTEYNEQSYTILSSPIMSFRHYPKSSSPVLSYSIFCDTPSLKLSLIYILFMTLCHSYCLHLF
jgi:hypothetical protein